MVKSEIDKNEIEIDISSSDEENDEELTKEDRCC